MLLVRLWFRTERDKVAATMSGQFAAVPRPHTAATATIDETKMTRTFCVVVVALSDFTGLQFVSAAAAVNNIIISSQSQVREFYGTMSHDRMIHMIVSLTLL